MSTRRLIPTRASWLCSGTRSGARLAQSTEWGEPARPSCECTIRRYAAQLLVVPETAGWAPARSVPGQVGTFHFLNGSVEGQGNHWSSRLSPGSARWVILIHDVYLQVQLSSPVIPKQSGLWVQDAWRARVGKVICDPLLELLFQWTTFLNALVNLAKWRATSLAW